MILSYHPCFTADINRICAGREPDETDRTAIRKAHAVILPQGCREALYHMARKNCRRVFPNYDARFQFPGKTGQARLFQETNAPHPVTAIFNNTEAYRAYCTSNLHPVPFGFPVVFKFDWGGEGETVAFISNNHDLSRQIEIAATYERSGQEGFILQQFVPCESRVLRVVRINNLMRSYWRVAPSRNQPLVHLKSGAIIDHDSDKQLQNEACQLIDHFCRKTNINLAGFDVIFPIHIDTQGPLILEINYFFGREGLDGTSAYLNLLTQQINRWLDTNGEADE